jgi:hypothetical protein
MKNMKTTKMIDDEELTFYILQHGEQPPELVKILEGEQRIIIEDGKMRLEKCKALYSYVVTEELDK